MSPGPTRSRPGPGQVASGAGPAEPRHGQGRDPSQFANVVPIQIRIDPRDRVVGGRLIAPSRGEGGAREDSPEVDPGQLQVELDNDDGLENDGTSEILRYPNRT